MTSHSIKPKRSDGSQSGPESTETDSPTFSIEVDGETVATYSVADRLSKPLTIPIHKRYLKIVGPNGEPMASLLLRHAEITQGFFSNLFKRKTYRRLLEDGAQLALIVRYPDSPPEDEAGLGDYRLQVKYQKPFIESAHSTVSKWINHYFGTVRLALTHGLTVPVLTALAVVILVVPYLGWLADPIRSPAPSPPFNSAPPDIAQAISPPDPGSTPTPGNQAKSALPSPPDRKQAPLPGLYVVCGERDLERKYCTAIKKGLARFGKWDVLTHWEKGAYVLKPEPLRGTDKSFLITLVDPRGIPLWQAREEITKDNLKEQAKKTVLQVIRQTPGRKNRTKSKS